jgi:hypothetical protein
VVEHSASIRVGAGSIPALRSSIDCHLGIGLATQFPEGTLIMTLSYANWQIAQALVSNQSHPDEATRIRAQIKVQNWQKVIENSISGQIDIGSNAPKLGAPKWISLEVIHGGFATGEMSAGGYFRSHEYDYAATLNKGYREPDRKAINAYFISTPGMQKLHDMAATGCYEITQPEEGALLMIAWLSQNGYAHLARSVLDEIIPFFAELRFYPAPAKFAKPIDSTVHLATVGEVVHALKSIK